jgi:thioredoxin-like negative regulator of GroEL
MIDAIRRAGYSARIVSIDGIVGSTPTPITELPKGYPELDAAIARAGRERKPVVVDFHATWCLPCKRMISETFAERSVKRLLEKCIVVTIDTDLHPDIARRFGVTSLPDIRIARPDGSIATQLVGFQSPAELTRALIQAIDSDR